MSRRQAQSYPAPVYGSYEDQDGYDAPAEPVRRSAPPSVHLAAAIGYLAGLAFLAIGVAAWMVGLGGSGSLDAGPSSQITGELRGIGLAGGVVYGLVGLFVLAFTRKLQRGRQWVRVVVVVLSAFTIIVTIYDGILGHGSPNALFGLVLPVICVVLLNLPTARSWFRRHTY